MKKTILAAALFAAVSINSFGAACVTGTMAQQAALGSCQINGWNLDVWSFGSGGVAQTGYSAAPTLADILVSFTSFGDGITTALGFTVSFSDNPDISSPNNYFSALSGSPNQTVNWKTVFNVTGAGIGRIDSQTSGANVTPGSNNGSIVLQKIIVDPLHNCGGLGYCTFDGTILTTALGSSANPMVVYNDQLNAFTKIGIVDNYQLNSGNGGQSSLTSYTNTFYGLTPAAGVPEPMTFVLMGAGLVGVAALRRRKR